MDAENHGQAVTLGHRVSYGLYRGFEWMLKPIPMELVCVIGGIIGLTGYLFLPRRKKTVIRNLRIAYGSESSLGEINSMCRKTYWRAGANFLAALRANTMSPEDLHKRMEIVGVENLRDARKPGTGFILLLAHMGSWETLVQMHLMIGGLTPFGGLYRPLGNPLLDKLVKRRRQKTGTKLFSRKDGFFTPIAHLKEGGTLGAFADQNAGRHGISVPFYGKLSSLTNLPALLHWRTGAPIMPVSMCTVTHGKWRVVIHPTIEVGDEEKTNATHTTGLCARAFERMMKESPTDVLWMHGYWKIGRKLPLKIDGVQKQRSGNAPPKATKPFKLLIFTGNISANDTELHKQLNRLIHYRSDIEIITAGESACFQPAVRHLSMEPGEPPHLLANKIRNDDQETATPIDCAIDITDEASGEKILRQSGVSPCFAMKGRYKARTTARHFQQAEHRNLSGLLESLALPPESPPHSS